LIAFVGFSTFKSIVILKYLEYEWNIEVEAPPAASVPREDEGGPRPDVFTSLDEMRSRPRLAWMRPEINTVAARPTSLPVVIAPSPGPAGWIARSLFVAR